MTLVNLSDKILPHFYDSWLAYDDPKYLHIYEKGGRGSSKSTTITMKIIMNRMKTKTHAVIVRKVGRTLRYSTRNQILWGIHYLGVQDKFKWSDTPSGDMTIEYRPTGTKIFFEGADGDKIKGWKTYDMPTTDIFFEEITDFKTDEELTSIKLSILREILPDGYKYTFFHAYNPPKRRGHWVNKTCESIFQPDNVYIHHSDYRDNIKFLPPEFMEEADNVKAKSKRRYDWEYLGLPIGSGVVPFDNLSFRTITDDEIKRFDNIRQGIDWGYGVDPVSFGRMHLDKTRNILYIFDEIYGVKISNRELAEKIRAKGYHSDLITCDSAEPKSVSEMNNEHGLKCIGAKKGAGSVEYGEKWLDDLEEIVIDPERCPNIAREFENIDYETDKDGNPKARLQDKDNHSIDMCRYACESDMKQQKLKTMNKSILGL